MEKMHLKGAKVLDRAATAKTCLLSVERNDENDNMADAHAVEIKGGLEVEYRNDDDSTRMQAENAAEENDRNRIERK